MNKLMIIISAAVMIQLGGCYYDKVEPVVMCDQPDTVSFGIDIMPVFNTHCNTAGCHEGSSPEGGLSLEPSLAYQFLTQTGSGYVDTVTPEFSLLYVQMKSTTAPMPPTGNLDECTQELILEWIKQGAKNN